MMYQRIASALKDRVYPEYLLVVQSWGDMCIEIHCDLKWSECLFDRCSDRECKDFLLAFLHGEISKIGFSVAFELAKLLAIKGNLVRNEAESILLGEDVLKAPSIALYLLWAYLGTSTLYEPICIRLLDAYEEDFRDGVFLACYRLNTFRIYRSLIWHFSKWLEDPEWGKGTGEKGALQEFLAQWAQTPGFCEHEKLRLSLQRTG